MAKAGRKKGTRHTEYVRDKIKATSLVNRLHNIAMGTADATPAQVNAAKSLLNKVLPDLKSVEHSGEMGHRLKKDPDSYTDEELAAIAASTSGPAST